MQKLRIDSGKKILGVDTAVVSKIETMKVPKNGNYITEYILQGYTYTFNKSYEEILFGNKDELEETLRWIFDRMFERVFYHDFPYSGSNTTDIDEQIQKTMLSLASTFAELNWKRYNFLRFSPEGIMDAIDASWTDKLGKPKPKDTNPDTTVTGVKIFGRLWIICKEKMYHSFKNEFIREINNEIESETKKFEFSSINVKLADWVLINFNKIIVPSIIKKLKSNSILKLGFLVEELINDFLDENIPISYQENVPVEFHNDGEWFHLRFDIETVNSYKELGLIIEPLTPAEQKEREEIISWINRLPKYDDIPIELQNIPVEKLFCYGIILFKLPKIHEIKEVNAKRVLEKEEITSISASSGANPSIIEFRQNIINTYLRFREQSLEDAKVIPGYLTYNSKVSHLLQNKMNGEVKEMILRLVNLQNELLKHLSDEEIANFMI